MILNPLENRAWQKVRSRSGFDLKLPISAWEQFLSDHHSLNIVESKYTMQACHVNPPDEYEYYQFNSPEFLQGIITVLNWDGVNWRDYLGPIFEFIQREVEIV